MSKRRSKRNGSTVRLPQSLGQIDDQLQKLEIHKSLLYEKLMTSNRAEDIMKAVEYQQQRKAKGVVGDPKKAF